MKRRSPVLGLALLVLSFVGCKKDKPAPFGSLRGNREAWVSDCANTLEVGSVLKEPDPLMASARDRSISVPFRAATTQTVCAPPGGWTLYTDANERIVGVCVDDFITDLRKGAAPKEVESNLDRAKPILMKHFGSELATDITSDHCALMADRVPRGLRRWSQTPRRVLQPDGTFGYGPSTGTVNTCCWEVIDP